MRESPLPFAPPPAGVPVQDLARAIQQELELRRGVLPQRVPAADVLSEQVRLTLRAHVQLQEHPPVARAGVLAPLVRAIRRVFKGVLRPWLEFQSVYNQAAEESVAKLHAAIVELKHELATLRADLGIGHWFADPLYARSNVLLTLKNDIDHTRELVAALAARLNELEAEKP